MRRGRFFPDDDAIWGKDRRGVWLTPEGRFYRKGDLYLSAKYMFLRIV